METKSLLYKNLAFQVAWVYMDNCMPDEDDDEDSCGYIEDYTITCLDDPKYKLTEKDELEILFLIEKELIPA